MRTSGILMHISSLPSPYGIGTFGKKAFEFVDFMKKSGQTYWQILPIGPTSYGDSPYQSFSVFAGNPYFIDLDLLTEEGLLNQSDYSYINWGEDPSSVDYEKLHKNRFNVLRIAFENFINNQPQDYSDFLTKNSFWLEDYSLFMCLKDHHNGKSWLEWDEIFKRRENNAIDYAKAEYALDIYFWNVVQYLFFKQWFNLKNYANHNGIKITGDLPIYTGTDSADVWSNTKLFLLDDDLMPIEVSGCPPDYFTPDGQLWGNPILRWDVIKETGYKWWLDRFSQMIEVYDVARLDHFRGFDSYYTIPAGEKTARNGKWKTGPGIEFFRAIENVLGKQHFIAEDLGMLTPSVLKLLEDTGYPGMKVLQFAFDNGEDSAYLPHNYTKNSVIYTGTHDNNTILGWFEHARQESTDAAIQYLRLTKEEKYNWGMMKAAWASVSDTSIVQMQDLLDHGHSARMNTPSTIGNNWKWRAIDDAISLELAEKIKKYMDIYKRIPTN